MQEHKHAGKSSTTGSHGHAHDDDHAPGPGKQSRVEQVTPIASAASAASDGGGGTSGSISRTTTFYEGDVRVDATFGAKLTRGHGKIAIDITRGGVQIGDDHMTVDFKSHNASMGKGLKISGAAVTTSKIGSTKSEPGVKDGRIAQTFTTEWQIKHKDWTATFSIAAAFSFKPPKRAKPKHRGVVGSVIHAIGNVVSSVAHAVADATEDVVKSAPEWGPYVVAAAAAILGSAQAVAAG